MFHLIVLLDNLKVSPYHYNRIVISCIKFSVEIELCFIIRILLIFQDTNYIGSIHGLILRVATMDDV